MSSESIETSAEMAFERVERIRATLETWNVVEATLSSVYTGGSSTHLGRAIRGELRVLEGRAEREALTLTLLSEDPQLRRRAVEISAEELAQDHVGVGHLLSHWGSYSSGSLESEDLKAELRERFTAITGRAARERAWSVRPEVESRGSNRLRLVTAPLVARRALEEVAKMLRNHQLVGALPAEVVQDLDTASAHIARLESRAVYEAVACGHLRASTLPELEKMAAQYYDAHVPAREGTQGDADKAMRDRVLQDVHSLAF